jgi:thiol:disulfide interchange protein
MTLADVPIPKRCSTLVHFVCLWQYGDAGAFEPEPSARARAEAEFVVRYGFSPWVAPPPAEKASTSSKKRAKPRKIATGAELARELEQPKDAPTLVVYGAKTCRMCKMVQPLLLKAAAKAGAQMLQMTYNKQSDDVYRAYNITATPTVHVHDAMGTLVAADVIYEPSDLPKLASVLSSVAEQ